MPQKHGTNAAHPERDLLCLGVLLAMTILLLRVWGASEDRYLGDVVAQMASYWLLPALGFLLCLRAGVVDLSVWMAFSAGGLLAATLMSRGIPTPLAMLVGLLPGLGLGVLNARLVTGSRVPSAAVTLITAMGTMLLLRWIFPLPGVPVPETAFDAWHILGISRSLDGPGSLPLFLTRGLLVIGVYALAMLTLLTLNIRLNYPLDPALERKKPMAALIASGLLSAAGGVLWLMDNPGMTVPSAPIEDLRVPAAAMLAGALLLTGRQRTLLAGVCLPPALLLTTIWRQMGCDLDYHGYSLGLLILLAGTALMAAAVRTGAAPPLRRWLWISALLAGGSLVAYSGSAGWIDQAAKAAGNASRGQGISGATIALALQYLGLAMLTASLCVYIAVLLLRGRRHAEGPAA